MTSTAIVAYLTLFAAVGFLFVLVSLLLGSVLRASVPTDEKLKTYECGEPAIGSNAVQFDLRFYVVALLFLIFEVEVAFFFPPATIFGKAIQVMSDSGRQTFSSVQKGLSVEECAASGDRQECPSSCGGPSSCDGGAILTPLSAPTLALASMLDLGVFFCVLLVGFAYIWHRGDLDWVRAVRHPIATAENAALGMKLGGDREP